jgi:hypothetical protein
MKSEGEHPQQPACQPCSISERLFDSRIVVPGCRQADLAASLLPFVHGPTRAFVHSRDRGSRLAAQLGGVATYATGPPIQTTKRLLARQPAAAALPLAVFGAVFTAGVRRQ